MIVTRTPLRISFVGGGTDLPAYYKHRRGAVVSATIDKYIYITANPRIDSRVRVGYSEIELVERARNLQNDLVRESLGWAGIERGIEITSVAEVPGRTGLGSSGAYTVGLLQALAASRRFSLIPGFLAEAASHVLMERCGRPDGEQDQYAAAYGGFNYFEFGPGRDVEFGVLPLGSEALAVLRPWLLLAYIGVRGDSATILRQQQDGVHDPYRLRCYDEMAYIATTMARDMQGDVDPVRFAAQIDRNWTLKRALHAGIAPPYIDDLYQTAKEHGVLGGKICGAGGGGFMLMVAPPDDHDAIRASLPDLRYVPFEFTTEGSRIVYQEA